MSKNGCSGERYKAFCDNENSIITKRDYAEAIEAKMNKEIQGDHFGEQGRIKLEGATAQFHLYPTNMNEEADSFNKHYFAHFSDDADQCAATSYENFYVQLLDLIDTVFSH